MKILVLTQQYPDEHNLYRNAFVHTRIKSYLEKNPKLDISVYVLPEKDTGVSFNYKYDGVNVIIGNQDDLESFISINDVDAVLVHFLMKNMIETLLLPSISHVKKIIWIHGMEALSWKRRMFNVFTKDFYRYVIGNIIQLRYFKRFVERALNCEYVFISEWMKTVCEEDLHIKFSNYHIIPNGIDTNYYSFGNKKGLEKNILFIRPFNSRKYATDIAMETIFLLSQTPNFTDYKITIVGEGKYFEKDARKIRKLENITFVHKFLTAREIKEYHKKNGIFLCPTRQDSQGVSMCEAMSSGLVPVTSLSTAIPEFVSNEVDGFLCTTPEEMKNRILELNLDQNMFLKMSQNAHEKIEKKCSLNKVACMEMNLFERENES